MFPRALLLFFAISLVSYLPGGFNADACGAAMHFTAKRKVGRLTPTRRAFLRGVAMMIGAGGARGAEADVLGELVAAFDGERAALGVPSISVALVEDDRVNLVPRGVKSASARAPWPES